EDVLNKSKTKVRPVYKKIKGNIIKDYKIWNQRKQIIIQVPIDIEFIEKAKGYLIRYPFYIKIIFLQIHL
ncbi:MAG: hypothetical protein ACLVIU_11585, partial [Paraclostridium sp.]